MPFMMVCRNMTFSDVYNDKVMMMFCICYILTWWSNQNCLRDAYDSITVMLICWVTTIIPIILVDDDIMMGYPWNDMIIVGNGLLIILYNFMTCSNYIYDVKFPDPR